MREHIITMARIASNDKSTKGAMIRIQAVYNEGSDESYEYFHLYITIRDDDSDFSVLGAALEQRFDTVIEVEGELNRLAEEIWYSKHLDDVVVAIEPTDEKYSSYKVTTYSEEQI
jgi:hypothetical protein